MTKLINALKRTLGETYSEPPCTSTRARPTASPRSVTTAAATGRASLA